MLSLIHIFYRIVEQTVNGVAVVLVILCSIDTTLRSDRVCAARRVLNAEVEHAMWFRRHEGLPVSKVPYASAHTQASDHSLRLSGSSWT